MFFPRTGTSKTLHRITYDPYRRGLDAEASTRVILVTRVPRIFACVEALV
jgi:hypothetical protein